MASWNDNPIRPKLFEMPVGMRMLKLIVGDDCPMCEDGVLEPGKHNTLTCPECGFEAAGPE